jgi:bifunctional non-homologous end joining protein LigD
MWSDQHQADIHFCVARDLASLVWAANLADLELHTYLSRAGNPDSPTMIVFDLDPGPPANIIQCAEVSFLLKEKTEALGLECFAKTSGSKGLQLYIPLNTKTSYDATKLFARSLAESLTRERPELVVSKMQKSLRTGKVLIDWSQNDRHKTTICAYSLRAKEHPTVSTPVSWSEVRKALKTTDPGQLTFTSDDVLKRVGRLGDLFEPVIKLKQKIPITAKPARRSGRRKGRPASGHAS